MRLSEKLASLSSNNIVAELNTMLAQAQVKVIISWWGQRLVSIEGYEGTVEINTLAKKYLNASPFDRENQTSLQDRLECYTLWGRVQNLYKLSEEELNKTWVYKKIVNIQEFRSYCRAYADDPMPIINNWDCGDVIKNSLLAFTPEEFKSIWPNKEPKTVSVSWLVDGGKKSERWMASKKMIEKSLQVS